MNNIWRGCFISEGLKDPRILNNYKCYKFKITNTNLPLDDNGTTGRWHMYWIESNDVDYKLFSENMKYNWYGHFWCGNEIVAIFEHKIFELKKDDKTTWKEAIEYGKSQNILEDQLDFLTD